MPVNDIGNARDLVFDMLKTAWAGQDEAPVLLYQDNAADPPERASYAEAEIQHQRGTQATIGEAGKRRFRAWARLTVTIRTPYGDGLTSSDAMTKIVQDAYEGKSTAHGEVQFRDVRVVEDGKDGAFYKVRVIVDFDYDRLK